MAERTLPSHMGWYRDEELELLLPDPDLGDVDMDVAGGIVSEARSRRLLALDLGQAAHAMAHLSECDGTSTSTRQDRTLSGGPPHRRRAGARSGHYDARSYSRSPKKDSSSWNRLMKFR